MSLKLRVCVLCMVTLSGISCAWLQPQPLWPTVNGDDQNMNDTSPVIQFSEVREDVNGLMEIVLLEYQPVAAVWQVTSITPGGGSLPPGPTEYYLKAIINYDPEIIREIQASAVDYDPQMLVSEEIFPGVPFVDGWFPDSVTGHLVPVVDSPGDLTIDVPTYNFTSLGSTRWAGGYFFIADDQTIFVFCSTW